MRGVAVLVLALLVCSVWPRNARADEDVQSAPEAVPNDDELGPLIQIEAIVIRGNTATQDEIIRRALSFFINGAALIVVSFIVYALTKAAGGSLKKIQDE